MVGFDTADDAAVYRMSDDLALIQTVDFFPPVVDDPYVFGQIGVANALSDVYAMGGHPLLALNIVCFPIELPKDILRTILQGAADKAEEAGVLIVGGQTIDDQEPKYGMAVTGIIKPGEEVTNASAQEGDIVVITKPIGTGVITTAGKQQCVNDEILGAAIENMVTLNESASAAMMEVGVNACTDVTGFGLFGHLLEMLKASGVSAQINWSEVPYLDGAKNLAKSGVVPGGTKRNLSSIEQSVEWTRVMDEPDRLLLCDAQTSGGLLISVSPDKLDALLAALSSRGVETAKVIGRIVAGDSGVHCQ